MNHINVLSQSEKREIEQKLQAQHGVRDIPGIIVKTGEERLFLFSGSLSEKEIKALDSTVPVERVGIYFAKVVGNDIKLSIEGSQILGTQINKNIYELNKEQAEEWMKGHELPIKTGRHGFLIMKHGSDFLGAGKASENKIGNFIPKNRRLREKS